MKRKLKIMTHQVDQLKEEISAKEAALVKLHLEQQRIEKEKETLKVQGLLRAAAIAGSFGLGRLPLTEGSGRQGEGPRKGPKVSITQIQKPPASGAGRITFVILRGVSSWEVVLVHLGRRAVEMCSS
jgi:hypothetical protein